MESAGISLTLALLAIIFPEYALPLLTGSLIAYFLPRVKEEREKTKYDREAVKIGFRIASLPVLTEKNIAEILKNFKGFERVYTVYRRTGKFSFPVYGERTAFLKRALELSLRTGNVELLRKAVEDMSDMEEVLAETGSLLATEKYTLMGSLAGLGLALGIVSKLSQVSFTPYLIFQVFLSSLWLRDFSEAPYLELLFLTALLIFAGFKLGLVIG